MYGKRQKWRITQQIVLVEIHFGLNRLITDGLIRGKWKVARWKKTGANKMEIIASKLSARISPILLFLRS